MSRYPGIVANFSGERYGEYQPKYELKVSTLTTALYAAKFSLEGEVGSVPLQMEAHGLGDPKKLALWWLSVRDERHGADIGERDFRCMGDLVFPAVALTLLILRGLRDSSRGELNFGSLDDAAERINTDLDIYTGKVDGTLHTNLRNLWLRSQIRVSSQERVVFEKK